MARKHHPTPLNGGDRKALVKELGRARAMTAILAVQSAEARAKGDALIRTADRLLCESWNERMWADGEPVDSAPTIDQAVNGGYPGQPAISERAIREGEPTLARAVLRLAPDKHARCRNNLDDAVLGACHPRPKIQEQGLVSGQRLGENVRVEGPDTYELSFTPTEFTVLCSRGTDKFSGIATNDLPKLYIASIDRKPIYVGLTKQSVRNRLRLGWNASGESGYYGYAWRHGNEKATLSVWCHMDAVDRNERDIETVEAEVVFLIRSAGQWPAFQTEIHFHPSTVIHRFIGR